MCKHTAMPGKLCRALASSALTSGGSLMCKHKAVPGKLWRALANSALTSGGSLMCKHKAMPGKAVARLGKLGVDLGRVAAYAQHLSRVLELRVLVPEQAQTGSILWTG